MVRPATKKKRRVPKRDPLPKRPVAARESDDEPLDDDDLAFLDEFGGGAAFLRRLDGGALEKPLPKKLPVPRRAASDSDSLAGLSDSDDDAGGADLAQGDDASDIASDRGVSEDEDADDAASNADASSVVSSAEETGKKPTRTPAASLPAAPAPAPAGTALPKKRKRTVKEDEDAELDYEKIPRASFKPKPGSTRLPIKLADGSIAFQPGESHADNKSDEEFGSDSDGDAAEGSSFDSDQTPGLEGSDDEGEYSGNEQSNDTSGDDAASFAKNKEELARVASGLLEDPQGRIAALKTLQKLTSGSDGRLKRLGMLTQAAVYKDIVPGYRIRQRTEAEKQVKVSQEVKKLHNFEEGLVSSYHAYVTFLEKTAKAFCSLTRKKASQVAPNTLADLRESAIVAVRCQTSLLTAIPHFNFRSELLQSVVDRMDRNDSTGIGAACCAAIVEVFENDDQGELSLEAVKMISKMIKDRSFRVARNVLDTFLHVRLNAARRRDEPAAAPEQDRRPRKQQKSTKPHVSKFQKKMAKQQKEVERTLKEAEAEVATEDRAKQQTETLKHMFLAYFRVLRACREKTVSFWTNSMSMELVLSTLDGLSRYAHMIDVDFFLDLLATLKTMAAQASEVLRGEEGAETAGAGQTAAQRKAALLVSLRSTIAAIQILSGQGEALNIDLKDFSEALYGSIMDVCFLPNGETQEALALLFRGLDMFLLRRKEPSLDRVAAFTKRLVTASLQLGERGCGGCLALLRSVLLKYPKLSTMLEADDKVVGQGFYLPYGSDPDIAHALSSTYWELGALGSHFHPTTGTVLPSIVAAIGKQSASKAGRASSRSEEPQAWLAKPSFLSTGLFDPPAFKKEQWRNIKV